MDDSLRWIPRFIISFYLFSCVCCPTSYRPVAYANMQLVPGIRRSGYRTIAILPLRSRFRIDHLMQVRIDDERENRIEKRKKKEDVKGTQMDEILCYLLTYQVAWSTPRHWMRSSKGCIGLESSMMVRRWIRSIGELCLRIKACKCLF